MIRKQRGSLETRLTNICCNKNKSEKATLLVDALKAFLNILSTLP